MITHTNRITQILETETLDKAWNNAFERLLDASETGHSLEFRCSRFILKQIDLQLATVGKSESSRKKIQYKYGLPTDENMVAYNFVKLWGVDRN